MGELAKADATATEFRILGQHTDADVLFALRHTTYLMAPEFKVLDVDSLRWGAHDDAGLVFGVFQSDRLIATLRANVFGSQEAAEHLFEYALGGTTIAYPACGISRVATDPVHARSGLNALLRRMTIEVSRKLGLRSVIGIVYEGAPRTRAMLKMGYEMWRSQVTWDRESEPISHPMIACLPNRHFDFALDVLSVQGGTSVGVHEDLYAQTLLRFRQMCEATS